MASATAVSHSSHPAVHSVTRSAPTSRTIGGGAQGAVPSATSRGSRGAGLGDGRVRVDSPRGELPGVWEVGPGLAEARSSFALTALPRHIGEFVIATGGIADGIRVLASCEAFFPPCNGRGRGRPPPSLPPLLTARHDHSSCCTADGKIIVAGGWGEPFTPRLDSVEMLDLAGGAKRWVQLAPLPLAENCVKSSVHVFARSDGDLTAAVVEMDVSLDSWFSLCTFSFESGVWQAGHNSRRTHMPSSLPSSTAVYACARSNDNVILSCGVLPAVVEISPTDWAVNAPHEAHGSFSTVDHELFDTQRLPRMAVGTRGVLGLATLADGRIIAIQGTDLDFVVEVYDPGALGWAQVSPLRISRCDFGVCSLPDGRLLVAGGVDEASRARACVGDAAVLRLPSRRWSVITHRIQVPALRAAIRTVFYIAERWRRLACAGAEENVCHGPNVPLEIWLYILEMLKGIHFIGTHERIARGSAAGGHDVNAVQWY